MGKRLVLSAIETYGGDVTFWVAAQTHRGFEFGNDSESFKSSGGYVLCSAATPCPDGDVRLWVRGSDRSADMRAIHVGYQTWRRIKAAVAEYNAHFADKPEPAAPSMPPIIAVD